MYRKSPFDGSPSDRKGVRPHFVDGLRRIDDDLDFLADQRFYIGVVDFLRRDTSLPLKVTLPAS